MWPFNRKKNQETSAVASEIQDYYQTERRERKGVAWLLAIVTFFVTLAVVLALFYGGKWLYRKVTDNDTSKNTDTSQVKDESQATEEETPVNTDTDPNEEEVTDSSDATTDSDVAGDTDEPQTSSTSTDVPSNQTTPVTGPSEPELPRTGPDQDL